MGDEDRAIAEDDGGPVVMLNLLRFADGGRERYAAYLEAARPFVDAVGGEVVFLGAGAAPLAAEPGQAWDAVLLVRYPHPQAWSLAFQTSVPGEVARRVGDDNVAVFIPTTPSPVNGFYFYVRKSETIELDMSVDVALRTIVSMGVVAAPEPSSPELNPAGRAQNE